MKPAELVERVLSALPEDAGRAASIAESFGTSAVWDAARPFGLRPLLAHHLPALFTLPKDEQYTATFQALRLTRTTVETCRVLQDAGVDALVLKGMALAARLFPEPWLRPSSDVDLLVRPRDLHQAADALKKAGWLVNRPLPTSAFQFAHDLPFTAPGRPLLEVHFAPSWHFQARFDVDALFARAVEVPLGGATVRALSPSDDLVQLCVHAGAHVFDGVKWLYDLKLAAQRGLDWDEVVRVAEAAKVSSITGLALEHARRRLDAPVPEAVTRALLPGHLRRNLAAAVERIPEEWARTRSWGFDVLLPDGLSVAWARRAFAPPVNRVARLFHAESLLPRVESFYDSAVGLRGSHK